MLRRTLREWPTVGSPRAPPWREPSTIGCSSLRSGRHPLLEIDALEAGSNDTVVVVSSGGCTALSLLAAGAGQVAAVDLNRTQNHLVELKLAAVTNLVAGGAVAFLGGWPAARAQRWSCYQRLRGRLTPSARAYWDAHRRRVERGVLGAGVSERFVGVVMAVLRLGIHPPGRVRRLLACTTIDEQRHFYDTEWDSRRWRLLFRALLNRAVFRHTYDDAFFRHVDNPSFARHFLGLAEHTLTQVPMATNYFVHHMLTGAYPSGVPGGLPPYLEPVMAPGLVDAPRRLNLVDGAFVDHLRSQPDASIDGFALSTSASGSTPSRSMTCSPRWCVPPRPALGWCSATSWAGPRFRRAGKPRWSKTGRGPRRLAVATAAPCSVGWPCAASTRRGRTAI